MRRDRGTDAPTVVAQCRGDGRGYLKIHVPSAEDDRLYAEACIEGDSTVLPCPVYDIAFPGEDSAAAVRRGDAAGQGRMVVVVVPLLDNRALRVRLFDGPAADAACLLEERYAPLRSKVVSRMTYLRDAAEARQIRDIDRRRKSFGTIGVGADGLFDLDEGLRSLRLRVDSQMNLAGAENEDLVFSVVGTDGVSVLRSWETVDRSLTGIPSLPGYFELSRMVSLRIPGGAGSLIIGCWRKGELPRTGTLLCLSSAQLGELGRAGHEQVASVSSDPDYECWFESHRSSGEEIALQRRSWRSWGRRPLVSIVVVLYRTPLDYLKAMLDSVLAQSYEHFELVLVNVSGDDTQVDGAMEAYDDARIRLIHAENRSIAENTNVGIRLCRGEYVAFVDHDDVVEPDALYRYVQAINESPDTDVLYCDEDHIHDGRYEWPVFKPAFNKDLLYSYNYITHMLMVSRHVLDQVDLSTPDVTGAQDYDLTLKCVEVARAVRLVPFILYHWRVHPASTSVNPDSKPYADEAGRLALERALTRCVVPAKPVSGGLPFTYSLEYQIGDWPKVSVVVPVNGDCCRTVEAVDGILERTAYPDMEAIFVCGPFARGHVDVNRLQGHKARIIRAASASWWGELCNVGAESAEGRLLLFLDPEIHLMDRDWLSALARPFARAEIGAVAPRVIDADGMTQHAGFAVREHRIVRRHYLVRDNNGYMNRLRYPSDCLATSSICQLVRRETFIHLGGMRHDVPHAYVDVDFGMRLHDEGMLSLLVPSVRVQWRYRGGEACIPPDPCADRAAIADFWRTWYMFSARHPEYDVMERQWYGRLPQSPQPPQAC